MIRHMFRLVMTFSVAMTFALVGCAGKSTTPAGASDGSGMGGSDSSATPSDTSVTGGAGASSISGGTLPVVYFEFNSASLREADRSMLQTAAPNLKAKSSPITIEGHCDERGSVEYNLALGERRAQAVKGYLMKLGIDNSLLSTISFGKERPADAGHTEDAWAKNRRAEMAANR